MLKEAIEKIESMAQPTIFAIGDDNFAITTDGTAHQIRPQIDTPDTLELNSLDALVKLIRTEALAKKREGNPLYITIPSHLCVKCFERPDPEKRCFRRIFYTASATDVPGWDERTSLAFEEAQIALRTRFQETPDTLYALQLLSNITAGAKLTMNDNGIATTVVSQKGIALQGNEVIRPIVKLRPYRTFQEIDQPESTFLIRITERAISFIEADGGMWKLHARETIKKYLEENLSSESKTARVVIAL